MLEARKMVGAVAESSGQPRRQPPERPQFALYGQDGHFAHLAHELKKRRDQDARVKEREWADEWAEQDRIRMMPEGGEPPSS